MIGHQTNHQDNRDSEQMYDYLESRITFLKARIGELEIENENLKGEIKDARREFITMYA